MRNNTNRNQPMYTVHTFSKCLCGVVCILLCNITMAATTGSYYANAPIMGYGQQRTVTLVSEYDPESREYYDSGCYYLKFKAQKGRSYTIYTPECCAASICLDIESEESFREVDWWLPFFGVDSYSCLGGKTFYRAFLDANDWDDDCPATGTYYIVLTGDIGESVTVRIEQGDSTSAYPIGSEERPIDIQPATPFKTNSVITSSNLDSIWYRIQLTKGERYWIGTIGGTDDSPMSLDVFDATTRDLATWSDGRNCGLEVLVPESGIYSIVVDGGEPNSRGIRVWWNTDGIHTVNQNGITWKITSTNCQVAIGATNSPAIPTSTCGEINIPKMFYGMPVVDIDPYAFANCQFITSAIIPEGVATIGEGAFSNCVNLAYVRIPSSVSHICPNAFANCGTSSSTGIVVFRFKGMPPSDCSSSAFQIECLGIYGKNAQSNWASAMESGMWNDMRMICEDAPATFSMPIRETAWTFSTSGGVATLGDTETTAIPTSSSGAVEIPSSIMDFPVETIGDGAFAWCSAVESITIPDGITNIMEDAFYKCTSLSTIIFKGAEPLSVDENAFNRVPSTCIVEIVSPAIWTGVTIPGTWQGLSTRHTPIYNTNLTSTSEPSEDIEFSFETNIILQASEKLKIYYALNATPISENGIPTDTAQIYSGPITITQSASVLFVAIDDFGDYGDVSQIQLTRIPAETTKILVSASIEDGTWFDDTLEVALSTDEGTDIYYTVDGSDPRISGTRYKYCTNLVFSTTTELACYGVDAVTGDWGPILYRTYYKPKDDGGPYIETINNVQWTFEVSDGTATVLGSSATGECVIPEQLGGRKVTRIGNDAFSYMNITSAIIPESVSFIGDGAFFACDQLLSVTFNGAAPNYGGTDIFTETPSQLTIHAKMGTASEGWTQWNGRRVVFDNYTTPATVQAAALTVTNVVIHYVINSITPKLATPVSEDTGFVNIITEVKSGGAVSVPSGWATNYPAFAATYGDDFTKALMKPTGKTDGAGNAMCVWQDYVAGTDPTDENDKFTASITIVDGAPVISYTPELTPEQTNLRVYKTYGKTKLSETSWTDITDKSSEERANYNFFKVTVEMK